jgi:hypothetical protein
MVQARDRSLGGDAAGVELVGERVERVVAGARCRNAEARQARPGEGLGARGAAALLRLHEQLRVMRQRMAESPAQPKVSARTTGLAMIASNNSAAGMIR